MVSGRELMKIQVEALFTADGNGRLRGINEPDGEIGPAPRFFFGHTKEGSICRFRYDLPEKVVTRLKEVAAAEPILMDSQKFPRCHSQFKDILQSHAPIERMCVGPAYRFPDRIEPPANNRCAARARRTLEAFLKLGFWYQRDRVGETRYYC